MKNKLIESISWLFAGFFVAMTGVSILPIVADISHHWYEHLLYSLSILITSTFFVFKGLDCIHNNIDRKENQI